MLNYRKDGAELEYLSRQKVEILYNVSFLFPVAEHKSGNIHNGNLLIIHIQKEDLMYL